MVDEWWSILHQLRLSSSVSTTEGDADGEYSQSFKTHVETIKALIGTQCPILLDMLAPETFDTYLYKDELLSSSLKINSPNHFTSDSVKAEIIQSHDSTINNAENIVDTSVTKHITSKEQEDDLSGNHSKPVSTDEPRTTTALKLVINKKKNIFSEVKDESLGSVPVENLKSENITVDTFWDEDSSDEDAPCDNAGISANEQETESKLVLTLNRRTIGEMSKSDGLQNSPAAKKMKLVSNLSVQPDLKFKIDRKNKTAVIISDDMDKWTPAPPQELSRTRGKRLSAEFLRNALDITIDENDVNGEMHEDFSKEDESEASNDGEDADEVTAIKEDYHQYIPKSSVIQDKNVEGPKTTKLSSSSAPVVKKSSSKQLSVRQKLLKKFGR